MTRPGSLHDVAVWSSLEDQWRHHQQTDPSLVPLPAACQMRNPRVKQVMERTGMGRREPRVPRTRQPFCPLHCNICGCSWLGVVIGYHHTISTFLLVIVNASPGFLFLKITFLDFERFAGSGNEAPWEVNKVRESGNLRLRFGKRCRWLSLGVIWLLHWLNS